ESWEASAELLLRLSGMKSRRPGRSAGDGRGLLLGLLLAGHGLLRALAGAGVGLGALPVYRQAAAVPQTLVAADLDLATDVGRDLATQVTLDAVVGVDVVAQPDQVLITQVPGSQVRADA